MRNKLWAIVAILSLVLVGNPVRAGDLRSEMEAANNDFLTAFNAPNPAAFLSQYTLDAVLIFNGGPPIAGPEAIREFWESRIKAGIRNHTYEIVNAWGDGKFAYQFAKAGVEFTAPSGAKTLGRGFTVRIFEKQHDGTWKTKLHMFSRESSP
jgi:ketosteroid isomerase-like protein